MRTPDLFSQYLKKLTVRVHFNEKAQLWLTASPFFFSANGVHAVSSGQMLITSCGRDCIQQRKGHFKMFSGHMNLELIQLAHVVV